ncbi:MAG: FkbM family methyltransferase [Halobacteriovoraceae bacterium]|nr:FkbM family methyltransferase [Halobacteriovoraceae bacterium]
MNDMVPATKVPLSNYLMDWKNIYSKNQCHFYFSDVGARGGLEAPWDEYSPIIETVAFEPDQTEYENLKKSSNFKVLNYGLSSVEEKISLNLIKQRGCSSSLTPNNDFLRQFPEFSRWQIEKVQEMDCKPLDSFLKSGELPPISFIKLDTQGTELGILEGAKESLKYSSGIQVEVEFQKLYLNQSLFSEVDQFIRNELGLELHDLRKTYWKYDTEKTAYNQKGKLVFGDALYFRPLHNLDSWLSEIAPEQQKQVLINSLFTAFLYGYMDYCYKLLESGVCNEILGTAAGDIRTILDSYNSSLVSFLPPIWKSRIGARLKVLGSIFRVVNYRGWATSGERLGAEKKFGSFIS